ncbi:MAG: hypothetical protein KDI98_05345, partial [Hyphomicrobiaceae bacterium]|nr:hypothetical protein [Hyphomicrobiaceae bacterium]
EAATGPTDTAARTLPADFDPDATVRQLEALEDGRNVLLRAVRDGELAQDLSPRDLEILEEQRESLRAINSQVDQLRSDLMLSGVPASRPVTALDQSLGPTMMAVGGMMTNDVVPNILNGTIPAAYVGATAVGTWGGTAVGAGTGTLLTAGGFSEGLADRMLSSDTATSASIKLFSPNAPGIKGGTELRDPLEEVFNLGMMPTPVAGTLDGKLHGWVANTAGISMSRPALTTENRELRTLTVSYMAGIQPELIGDLKNNPDDGLGVQTPAMHVKSLTTGAVGAVYSYSVTASPDRLRAILSGTEALPDLNDPTTLRDGDTITWDMSGMAAGEEDLRIMFGKSLLKGGLDIKADLGGTLGQRSVVRIEDNDETGERHAIIFDGSSQTDRFALAVGGIYNPAIPETGKAGNATPLSAHFTRLTVEAADTDMENQFRFAEVNMDRPAGNAVIQDFLQTGVLPRNLYSLEREDAVTAHGTLDFESTTTELGVRAVSYIEARQTGVQLAVNGYYNLGQSSTFGRGFELAKALDNSVLRGGERSNTSAEAHILRGVEGSFGLSDSHTEVSGNNRYMNSQAIYVGADGETYTVKEGNFVTALGVPEWNLTSLIERDTQRLNETGSSIFSSIEVVQPDKTVLTGDAARAYLEEHKDPNSGWFTPEKVNMDITTEDGTTWRDFTSRIASDAEAYLQENRMTYAMMGEAQSGLAISYLINRYFGTGGVTGDNPFQLMEYVENAKNSTAQGDSLARSVHGFLQIAPSLHGMSDQAAPYPIKLRVYAPEDAPPPPPPEHDPMEGVVIYGP